MCDSAARTKMSCEEPENAWNPVPCDAERKQINTTKQDKRTDFNCDCT